MIFQELEMDTSVIQMIDLEADKREVVLCLLLEWYRTSMHPTLKCLTDVVQKFVPDFSLVS